MRDSAGRPESQHAKTPMKAHKQAKSVPKDQMAEREGIEPTRDRLPLIGFENRGDHQAHSTLRGEGD